MKGNPFALTIADLFHGLKPKNSLYVVYSDQPPDPYNGTAKGHTKGLYHLSFRLSMSITVRLALNEDEQLQH